MANDEVMSMDKRVALLSSQTTQWITGNIADPKMALAVPEGYNVGNEVASLMFAISQTKDKSGKSVFEVCSPDQIMNQVRDCVLNGLSISKKHVWPIIYGGKLSLQVSVYGKVAAFKYLFPDYEIGVNVLYEGDTYDYCTDDIANYNYITNVHSSLENRDKKIIAAYGSIYDTRTKERIYGCVMTWAEIQKNWSKSKSTDNSVQKDFPQEMAKRTLINRMVKMYVNSPNHGKKTEAVAAFNRMTANEYDDELQNVTPPENEIQRQKLIKGRSKGKEGLRVLLASDAENVTQNASKESGHEITPPAPENAPESAGATSQAKSGREPSVRMDENGEIVPAPDDDELDDDETMLDEDGNPMLLPF